MKLIIISFSLSFIAVMCSITNLIIITKDLENENIQLKHEKEMFAKLYREANTAILHYRDSVKLKCICR